MISTYLLFKLVHLVAVVLFLGNVTFGIFWVAHAERSRDPKIVGHSMLGIVRSDRWFTVPGVLLIVAGGVAAAMAGHLKLLSTGWIIWPIVLFSISGLVFGFALAPLQRKILSMADTAAADIRPLKGQLQRWHLLSWISLAPLWLALAMMVLKWPA